jgi:ABC-type glycerol-3-phosphate transport system permease component
MGAVGTVATLPVLAFAIYVQKYLVQGLTAGAIKG